MGDGWTYRSFSYDIRRGNDPGTMETVFSGTYASSTDSHSLMDLGYIRLIAQSGNRVVLVAAEDHYAYYYVIDAEAHAVVGTIGTPFRRYTFLNESAWSWSDGVLDRYDWDQGEVETPVGEFPMSSPPALRAPDRNLMLNVATDDIEVFDTSDATRLVRVATIHGPEFSRTSTYAWDGYRYITAYGQTLRVIDFSDPSAPFREPDIDLGYTAEKLFNLGGRLVIVPVIQDDQGHPALGYTVADMPGPGGPIRLSPLIEVSTPTRDIAVFNDVLYMCDDTIVVAYDISDLTRPTLIGRAVAGMGNLAVVGDYLATGQVILPRDCHDLLPPLEITIDIKPVSPSRNRNIRSG